MFFSKQNKNKNNRILRSGKRLAGSDQSGTSWINYKYLNIFLFTLISAAGVYYLSGINDLSVKSYEIKGLKKQINRLNSENNNYELAIMDLGSYLRINERAKLAKMVAADNVQYIQLKVEMVAKK